MIFHSLSVYGILEFIFIFSTFRENLAFTNEAQLHKFRNDSLQRKYNNTIDGSDDSWFFKVPLLPIVFANSAYLPDGLCKKQARRYLRELRNGTLWAVKMFDASTKYPEGVLSGHTRHLGNFDQCYNVHVNIPNEEKDNINERIDATYCLIDIRYRKENTKLFKERPLRFEFDPNDSVWEAISEKGDPRRIKRYVLQMALCIPSSCTANDVEVALKRPLEELSKKNNVSLEVSVKSKYCQTLKDEPSFSIGAFVYCFILIGLFILMIASTWYESTLKVPETEKELIYRRNLFLCFSARRNLKNIFRVSYINSGLDSIHLIRFFGMNLVIFGHGLINYALHPTTNLDYFEKAYEIPFFMIVFNGPLIIDAFLTIGGLLTAYILLEVLEKYMKLPFMALIVNRFLRLTPLYATVIFFNATILPQLGSGPYWKSKIIMERNYCASNWWTNLLYINNYVNTEHFCIYTSWYLSVDFQLYLLSLIVMYIFWRLPRNYGYSFLGFLTFISCSIPFIATYSYHVPPVYRPFLSITDIRDWSEYQKYYMKTHLRAMPYLVGLIAGAFMYDYKYSTWKIPKVWSHIMFFLFAIVLPITSQNLAYKYFDPNNKWMYLEGALYAGLNKALFATSVCSIVLLLTISNGLEFHYNFFTPSWVQPLSRLTYAAFHVHQVYQFYNVAVARAPYTITIHSALKNFVSDMFYTFVIALLMTIWIELPFRNVLTYFTSNTELNLSNPKNKDVARKLK